MKILGKSKGKLMNTGEENKKFVQIRSTLIQVLGMERSRSPIKAPAFG